MDRLTLSSKFNDVDSSIWLLENGIPKQLITDDCEEYEYVKKLAEYENLEEQGLLLKLPCKVGDTVYEVQKIRRRIQSLEIISAYIGRMGELYFNWELKDGIGIYQNIRGFGMSQLGKTVFLTQAEAEETLERMEREELANENT